MTLIVKTVTRLTVGLILIYGIYIVMRGHISPGGGFAGGVIIALSFIHLMLAFGKGAVAGKINEERGILIAAGFGMVLLCIATFQILRGVRPPLPLRHTALFGAGLIPWYDIVSAVGVGTELFVVFLALVLFIALKEEK